MTIKRAVQLLLLLPEASSKKISSIFINTDGLSIQFQLKSIRMKKIFRATLICLLPLTLIISVPWYNNNTDIMQHSSFTGLPDWVAVALLCYTLVPLINILIWATCYPQNDNDN